MSIRELIQQVTGKLPIRAQGEDGKQLLARTMKTLGSEVGNMLNDYPTAYVSVHDYNSGNWADIPWIGIHDNRINSKSKTGVYVAILFNVVGNGFSFTIQCGTDGNTHGPILHYVEKLSREFLIPAGFSTGVLSLCPDDYETYARTRRPRNYEKANVVGKQYITDNLPNEVELVQDLFQLIECYSSWATSIVASEELEEEYQCAPVTAPGTPSLADSEPPSSRRTKENTSYSKSGPRRDIGQGNLAILNASFKCEYNPQHQTFLTKFGSPYMEKHHLIPMEKYNDFELDIDHYINIFSICPTCHRAIHHGDRETKRRLVADLFQQREGKLHQYYKVSVDTLFKYYKCWR